MTGAVSPQTLLIVDDEPAQLQTLCDIFADEGFAVCPCATRIEVLEHCRYRSFDIAVLDLRLAECDGTDLLAQVQELQPGIRTVIYTGYGSFDSAKNAVNLGAFAYVEKRGDPAELVSKVHQAAKDVLSEALTESERRYQSLLNDIDAIVWEATLPEFQFSFVSQQLQAMLGYSVNQWLKDPEAWANSIYAEDRAWAVNYCRECAQRGEDYEFEYRAVASDGRIVWLHDIVHVIKDGAGIPCKSRGVMFDVTARKKVEEDLRTSESLFRSIFEQAAVGVALIETKVGRFVRINEKYAELIGYSNEQMTRLTFKDITYPDDLDEDLANMRKLHVGEIAEFSMEKRLSRKDGTPVWVNLTVSPTWQPGEEPKFHIAVVEDISRRKLAEEALRSSEDQYRSVVAALSEGITVYDRDMKLLARNASAERILGLTARQMMGRSLTDDALTIVREDGSKLSPDEYPAVMTLRTAKSTTGQIIGVHRPDGDLIWLSINTQPLFRDDQLQPYAVLTSFEDITDRKRAQQQLRFTRFAIEHSDEAMFTINSEGQLVDVNETACERLQYSRSELLEMTVAGINPHYPIEQWPNHWNEVKQKGKVTFESEHMTKDGRVFPVEISKSYVEFEGHEYAFAFVRDISERLQSQQLLAESEARYRSLVENAPEAILVFDVDSDRFVDFNENALRLFRVDQEQMKESGVAELSPPFQPDGKSTDIAAMEKVNCALEGEALTFEWTHRDSRGHDFPCEVRLIRLPASGKRLLRASVTDISERKLTEQRLRESETKFRAFSERSSALVAILLDGRFRYANPAAVAITGYSVEELAETDFLEIVHPQFRALVAERHLSRQRGEDVLSQYEFKVITKSGRERWVDLAAEVIEYEGQPAVLATCIDVTQRKFAEEQLRDRETQLAHMSRVTAMGEMASALAHELTQPLGAAANYAGGCIDLIAKRQSSPDMLATTLEKLNEQVLRSGKIVGQLKSFVSQCQPCRNRLNATDLIYEVEQLVAGQLSQHQLKLRFDFDCEMREIYADKIQIEQVLVNLVGNAIEAMLDATCVEREIVMHGTVVDGVPTITIRDSGKGIGAGEAGRIFEPYFTTKPDGMGMGLSICRTIINNHGGKLWVTPNEEGGSSFHFTLPFTVAEIPRDEERTQQTRAT